MFSHSVVSDSLWPHGLQHARLPCPSPTPGACSNSCPLSRWCDPTISSSVIPFSSCLQSFLASGSFLMSQPFASHGQSIRASTLAPVPSMNIQDWFPLGWTGWISLLSKGLKSLLQHHSSKASILRCHRSQKCMLITNLKLLSLLTLFLKQKQQTSGQVWLICCAFPL